MFVCRVYRLAFLNMQTEGVHCAGERRQLEQRTQWFAGLCSHEHR